MEKKIKEMYLKLLSIGNLLQPVPSQRIFTITQKESSIIAGPFRFTDAIFKILYGNKQQVGTDQPLVYVKKAIDGKEHFLRSHVPMPPIFFREIRRSCLITYSPRGPKAGGNPAKIGDLAIWEAMFNPNAEIYLGFEFEKTPHQWCGFKK